MGGSSQRIGQGFTIVPGHSKDHHHIRRGLESCSFCTSGIDQRGHVTVATRYGDTYVELKKPTIIHGLAGALFQAMWWRPDNLASWKRFDLFASTVITVHNQSAREAGLYTRMIRCQYPDKRVRIIHDAEAPAGPGLSDRHKRALSWHTNASKRTKDVSSGQSGAGGGYRQDDGSWSSWQWDQKWDNQDDDYPYYRSSEAWTRQSSQSSRR